MAVWLAVVLIITVALGCAVHDDGGSRAPAGAPEPAAHEATLSINGQLGYCDGALAYVRDGREQWCRDLPGAEPYRVVCLGPPALVTTVAADLTVSTHAVGDGCVSYPGMYPLVAEPPVVVLGELMAETEAGMPRTVLLAADGAVAWPGDAAAYLAPALAGDTRVAYFAQASAVDETYPAILFPYGDTPRLTAVDAASGAELWSIDLEAPAAVADVQLWALTPAHGLLSLQYDYRLYEFLCFDRATGEVGTRHRLAGQPATRTVYPGAFAEPSLLSRDGDCIELGVFLADGTPETWRIDLASGELSRGGFTPQRPVREENPLPVGGTGTPGPGAVPFSQRLLPEAAGGEWAAPALVNDDGAVLLLVDGQAYWDTVYFTSGELNSLGT